MIFSGKYEVQGELGRGGMGVVYRVRHLHLDTILALKVLPLRFAGDPDLVERFRREAKVMARLRHPHIVRVVDFDREGDQYYFAMEFAAGQNLAQRLRAGAPLPMAEALAIVRQVAEALAYAHRQRPAVVHRDIKPSNIIIEAESGRAVVTDFGIAKLLGGDGPEHTRTGMFMGTLKYSAPEQVQGARDVDGRADVYSLGLVLFELLTGRAFFAGVDDSEVLARLFDPSRENVPALAPTVPPALRELVARAISKDRSRRPASADEMVATLVEIEKTLGDGTEVPPTLLLGDGSRPLPSRASSRRGFVAAMLALIVLLATGTWLWRALGDGWRRVPLPDIDRTTAPREGQPSSAAAATPGVPRAVPSSAASAHVTAPTAVATAVELPTRVPLRTVVPTAMPAPTAVPLAPAAGAAALLGVPDSRSLRVPECASVQLAITGEPADARFDWSIDGDRQSTTGPSLGFIPDGPGMRRISAGVAGAPTRTREWEVNVVSRAPTADEVDRWLADYRDALVRKDVARLRALDTTDGAEADARRLQPLGDYQVDIQAPRTNAAEGRATVTFDLVSQWRDQTTRSMVMDFDTATRTLVRRRCQVIAVP